MLLAEARNRANALREQLASARERLLDSRQLLARIASPPPPVLPHVAQSGIEPSEPAGKGDGSGPTFAAVTQLIEQVEQSAARDVDIAHRLIEDIVMAVRTDTDPSLLIGVLLEGIAEAVLELLPAPERRDTGIALCGLLWDRISQGLGDKG
jgi:hypothetical protein